MNQVIYDILLGAMKRYRNSRVSPWERFHEGRQGEIIVAHCIEDIRPYTHIELSPGSRTPADIREYNPITNTIQLYQVKTKLEGTPRNPSPKNIKALMKRALEEHSNHYIARVSVSWIKVELYPNDIYMSNIRFIYFDEDEYVNRFKAVNTLLNENPTLEIECTKYGHNFLIASVADCNMDISPIITAYIEILPLFTIFRRGRSLYYVRYYSGI